MKKKRCCAVLFPVVLLLLAAFTLWRGGAFSPALPFRGETAPAAEDVFSPEELAVIELVNREREKEGLSPLVPAPGSLAEASRVRAEEASASFSHTRPDGRSWSTALEDSGVSYRRAGENLAFGQPTSSEAVAAWMASEGHRANILGDYTGTSVSCFRAGNALYWSQLFIR